MSSFVDVDIIPLAENRAIPRYCCKQLTAATTGAAAARTASSARPSSALPLSLSFSPMPTVVLDARFPRVESRLIRPTLHDNKQTVRGGRSIHRGCLGRREQLLPAVDLRTDFYGPRIAVSFEEPPGQPGRYGRLDAIRIGCSATVGRRVVPICCQVLIRAGYHRE